MRRLTNMLAAATALAAGLLLIAVAPVAAQPPPVASQGQSMLPGTFPLAPSIPAPPPVAPPTPTMVPAAGAGVALPSFNLTFPSVTPLTGPIQAGSFTGPPFFWAWIPPRWYVDYNTYYVVAEKQAGTVTVNTYTTVYSAYAKSQELRTECQDIYDTTQKIHKEVGKLNNEAADLSNQLKRLANPLDVEDTKAQLAQVKQEAKDKLASIPPKLQCVVTGPLRSDQMQKFMLRLVRENGAANVRMGGTSGSQGMEAAPPSGY